MSIFRRTSAVVTGVVALCTASMAFADINDKVVEQLRSRGAGREQTQAQPAPPARPAPQVQQPAPAPQQSRPAPAARESIRGRLEQQQRPAPAPAPVAAQPSGGRGAQPGNRGNDSRGNATRNDGNPIADRLIRNARGNNPPNAGGDRGDYRPDRSGTKWRGESRRPRVVQTLPRGYRNYNWNGRPYYTYGGSWYQPYGSSYIAVGVPYGLFVSSLPGYSSSFYYGNSRYYYYDDTYYLYEPARRGYVVARSPYGDDEDDGYYDDALDEDMYIYPAKGQSEQQQADDRYECHRWGVSETGYDPIDDEYDASRRAEYVRAMTACLTGRGYSVR